MNDLRERALVFHWVENCHPSVAAVPATRRLEAIRQLPIGKLVDFFAGPLLPRFRIRHNFAAEGANQFVGRRRPEVLISQLSRKVKFELAKTLTCHRAPESCHRGGTKTGRPFRRNLQLLFKRLHELRIAHRSKAQQNLRPRCFRRRARCRSASRRPIAR